MKKSLFLVLLFYNFFGYCQYTAIPDVSFEKALIDLNIDSGVIDGKVLTVNIENLTSLSISDKRIADLTGIQDFISLTYLMCANNQLTSLNFSENTALNDLNCGNNLLTSLDVSKNIALSFLNCSNNQLTSLDVTKNTALTKLSCDYNQLTNLDVSQNTVLQDLNCSYNQLASLNVFNNTTLAAFYCNNNQLTSLDVSKNTVLSTLFCNNNNLNNLDLSKNTLLIMLHCEINQISYLNISNALQLRNLICFSNNLTNLDASNNPYLMSIYCMSNKLTSLNLKNGTNTNILLHNFTSNPSLNCIQVDDKTFSDTNWSVGKDATSNFSENCNKTASNVAPIITATGNQIYCPETNIKIATSVNIVDSDDTSTDEMYIQISTGYVLGQDQLTLAGTHPTIATSWDINAGKLRLYSPNGIQISYLDFIAAIQDVEFNNSTASPSGIRKFSISIGQANYLPSTQHYYEFVPSLGITWTAAKTAAETSNYYGLQGYLATILADDEAQLSGKQAKGAGWIGGSDSQTEGVWKWVTGPEGLANGGTGIIFWNGLTNGTTPNFAYWNTNEPNQSGDEDYAHVTAPGVGNPGSWNDLSNTGEPNGNYQPKGYIVEYGGMPGDPTLQISASTTITIPKITSTIPSSICGSGVVTLQSTATDGIVSWYTSNTGGTPIATGNSFTTPTLMTTTSYYVDAASGNCPSVPRTEIIATINPVPTITATSPTSRCDSGTATLVTIASAGTINWYNVPTGGTSLGTGNSFTTPNIVVTTTYYVDATASGCTTPNRTAITATVNNSPSITSTTPASRCDTGTVALEATASTGTINWYDDATGGISLATGNSFTTPSLTSSKTYYVDATASGCTTPIRTAITAIINPIPTITATTPSARCDKGAVTLGAVASAGTINWYDVPTGGISLGTGTSFTTPSIASTTTYYVDAAASGCRTATRTTIAATVNISPSIISTTPASRCDTGTVTLAATASAGIINWYNVQTGGTSLGTGPSFTTPSIASTTTYYVDTTNQCTSPRLAVVATIYPILKLNEEVLLCQSETAPLDASIPGMNYLWFPGGETTQTIVVSSIGDYNVTISSPLANCDSKKDFKVIEHPEPVIKAIIVNENSITIELENPENYYEFSIDGELFQVSNQFSYIPSGQHTAYVREKNLCNLVQQDFTIFTIAKYFTPNNDGFNDVWEIKEMKNFPNSSALIFDRYGKLITTLSALKYEWDGKYNNQLLPAADYWYRLKMEDFKPEIRGHFSLKR